MAERSTSRAEARLIKRLEAAEREQQIQSAVDGVLQCALAMKSAEDIANAVDATRDALVALGLTPTSTYITIFDKGQDLAQGWHAWQKRPVSFRRGYRMSIAALSKLGSVLYAPRRGRQRLAVTRFTRRQLTSELNKLRKAQLPDNPGWRLANTADRFTYPNYRHSFYFSGGIVGLDYPRELTKPEIAIGHRIADAFDVAFHRFVELQATEAQNRELTIQNALERVRAQALGMQSTSDLPTISSTLFRELDALQFPVVATVIAVLHEDRDWFEQFTTVLPNLEDLASQSGTLYGDMVPAVLLEQGTLSRLHSIIPAWKKTFDAWHKTAVPVHKLQFNGDQVLSIIEDLVEIDFWTKEYAQAQADIVVGSVFDQCLVYYKHGRFCLNLTQPLSDFEAGVILRFTEVFSFAYDRFLELQAAEESARQAQIERAAEHIRAEAMAMRGTADLMDVVGLMHQSLHQLGVEPFSTSIHFVDGDGHFQHYLAVRDLEPYGFVLGEDTELLAPTKLVEGGWRVRWHRPQSDERLAVWREGRVTTSVMNIRPERYLQRGSTFYVPDPDNVDWSVMARGAIDYTVVPFRYGVVTFTVPTVSDQHIATVQTLADALSLGYMRFQDFQQLEQASINKSQFLRRMSHDLRSPMNAIIGYSRLLRRRTADRLDERERRNLANIETSSGNLLNLINDILDLSRIEAGRIEVDEQPVDIRKLVNECADSLESIVHENVTLRRELDDVGQISSDPDRLRQVVMNLLGNATKFTESGSITLSLRRVKSASAADGGGDSTTSHNGQAIELSVADTGIGIPAEDLPHIFDEFRQVERQGGEQEGTGLGLAIAKKTIDLLGGEITATSEVRKGTTFTVRLSS